MNLSYLKSNIRMRKIVKLFLISILTLTISSAGLKLTNNLLQGSNSRIAIETSLEYNAFNANKNLETLRDIKENLERFSERKSNKFTHVKHKVHTEKFFHF
ncbi:MAG: hypothetical protein ACRCYE_02525 [Sarcina sp.]